MKIAIVTIYSALNYGSYLQAFAMQNVLKAAGHEVVLLNCGSESKFRDIKRKLSRKHLLFSVKRYHEYAKDWRKLSVHKYAGEEYDVAIIGSDEVWNIKGSFEQWPQYFGKNLNAKKIIAYAPSIGFCPIEEMISDKRVQTGMQNFDIIFPRDAATKQACESIASNIGEIVVDPTLLYLESWNKHIADRRRSKKYIVYYSYLDETPMKEYILRYAKENNYQVYIAGFHYTWGDKIAIVSPLKFLSLLQNAEVVFTSTFHGTVFSTILQKNVVIRPSGQKVTDYLNWIGLNTQVFKDDMSYGQFKEMSEHNINYEAVKKIQEDRKNTSLSLLLEAIKND